VSRQDEIADAARRVLESEGLEALTMRRLADEVGVQAPSLYKHVRGREAVLGLVQAQGLREFDAVTRTAARRRPGGVAAMARGDRTWALDHPRLYDLVSNHPLQREHLPEGLEGAAEQTVLDAAGGDRARARALWAVAHGLVSLELAGRFPPGADLDAAWAAAVEAFQR